MSKLRETNQGKVYLVGAGPGDPELITVKGQKALERADVVFYDRLVNIELIRSLNCDKYFVGKKKNIHYYSQSEINRLLVRFAREGKTIVRLKGGDPFIFGRGGEEMAALIENGIDFEIIPGLSSSFSVASSIGLPLTHRDISSSIAIVTGHRRKGAARAAIPKADTIVFLMGLSAIDKIVDDLRSAGFDPKARIAVISKGTLNGERYVSAKLDKIEEKVRKSGIKPPAVVVFGNVVSWYDKMRTSDKADLYIDELILFNSE